jgi:S-adenosylmethionine:tRNA ribosyltransferase-isomerase
MDSFTLSAFDYTLPPEQIAQTPADPRDHARLLTLSRATGAMEHAVFRELGRFLRPGDLLVVNNTRVFPARTLGFRATGGAIEVFFLRDLGGGRWQALIRCHGKPKNGEYVELEDGKLSVKLGEKTDDGSWVIGVPRGTDLLKTLAEVGRMPLPPYIGRGKDRAHEPEDRDGYQTVFARETGAVAAPTAGLHFTAALLDALQAQGIGRAEITLHVGPGTFQPVKEEDIRRHKMHEEYYSISPEAAARILETRRAGGRIVAVGTTACRALETAALADAGFAPGSGWTRLYVYPPWTFRMTDALITNFHLPKSTLLMLVSALAGRERVLAAYAEAQRLGYRFYSYGDAMLILP